MLCVKKFVELRCHSLIDSLKPVCWCGVYFSRSVRSVRSSRCVWSRCVWSRILIRCVCSRTLNRCVRSRTLTRCVWSRILTRCVWSRIVTRCVWSRILTRCVWSRWYPDVKKPLHEHVNKMGWFGNTPTARRFLTDPFVSSDTRSMDVCTRSRCASSSKHICVARNPWMWYGRGRRGILRP